MHEVEEGVHLLLRENGLVVADEEEASVHARIVNCATGLLLALARPILLDEGPDIDHRQRVEAPPRFLWGGSHKEKCEEKYISLGMSRQIGAGRERKAKAKAKAS